MKKSILITIILLSTAVIAQAQPKKFPTFNLPDPQGGMHSSQQLSTNGAVVIVTSPILNDKSAQEQWSRNLASSKGEKQASLILIEDISASAFKGTVESHMKKAWKPGDLPILLEDETGKFHSAFGVGKDQTSVFVFDKNGNLVYSNSGQPSEAAAQTVWGKIPK